MELFLKDSSATPGKTDLLAVLAFEGEKPELPGGVRVGKGCPKGFTGEFRETRSTDSGSGPAARVLFVGLGKPKDLDPERLRRAGALCAKRAEEEGAPKATVVCSGPVASVLGEARSGRALAEGLVMGSYRYDAFKSEKKPAKLRSVLLHGPGRDFRAGAKHGECRARANCFARDLQNAPANHMRPRDLVASAKKLASRSQRIRCRALSEAEMKKLGMGCLLSVSRGSSEPAFLIHLTYTPKGRSKGRIALVGKGLTFDSGGISIKPSAKMDEMKYDMSGGAAVLGVFHALSALDLPFEVHGVVATSENMPDASATKPGDVVTAMDGTTIEVLNTDAEGRLVLADALCYAVDKIRPDTILDLATLTGAVVVALGHELSGIFPSTDALRDGLLASGKEVGELVWPLPLLDCHKEQMKSKLADLRNINSGQGNGASAGAAFLATFVGDTEWCHLDIAGTAWGGIERDWVGGPQGSGVGVRLLLEYLETRAHLPKGVR